MADRRVVSQRGRSSPRTLRAVGAASLAAAAVIVVGQWLVYEDTPLAQSNRVRTIGVAIVLVVTGVRLVLTPALTHETSVRLVMLAGGSLGFFALLSPHERPAAALVEGLCGIAVLFAALVALPPVQPERH